VASVICYGYSDWRLHENYGCETWSLMWEGGREGGKDIDSGSLRKTVLRVIFGPEREEQDDQKKFDEKVFMIFSNDSL